MSGNASVEECARPRAQHPSQTRRCRALSGAAQVRTLLRQGTGALRQGITKKVKNSVDGDGKVY